MMAIQKKQLVDGNEALVELLERQIKGLAHLAKQLDRLIEYTAPVSPDYKASLSEFAGFNWAEIGAEVIQSDNQGPVAVRWNRQDFVRRAGDGKFGKAIWFSRCVGKEGGENVYARLVTFKGDGSYAAERVAFI